MTRSALPHDVLQFLSARRLAQAGYTILTTSGGVHAFFTFNNSILHEKNRIATPRRERLEQGKPLYRLDRRRSFRKRAGRSARGGPPAETGRLHLRSRPWFRAQARDTNDVDCARRAGPDVDPTATFLASERAPLRCLARLEQDRHGATLRARADPRLAPQLRHSAAAAG